MNSQSQARQIQRVWQQGLARRQFLKWGLGSVATVAAVAAGGFALLRRSPRDAVSRPGWAADLSDDEFHLFDRAREVLLPVAGTALVDSAAIPVVQNIQRTLNYLDPVTRKELGAGLGLLDNIAVFTHGCRFVDLELPEARQMLDRWGEGGVLQRTLATVLKQLVYSAYWQDPQTWQPVEFDGPVSDKWGLSYLGNAPLPGPLEVSAQETTV
ncbi:hypothetical protein Y5S_00899 [Alcanivorax nanhaiticus]|uniref:Uncharacterized protein n=1 Tax=Alcanivorax nanhaiticus TaxID=1177154 RepID=A0A095UT21_9GAMM|nr:gluconate 2-dehydrogenase subunit 3 family protein [Alcanivorax nanhaiticus]KGD65675.1 hypothetical protein Y5S_00899 [Alcanivorax nanhaiticus]